MITQCVIHIFVWLSGPDGEVLVIKTLDFPFYLIWKSRIKYHKNAGWRAGSPTQQSATWPSRARGVLSLFSPFTFNPAIHIFSLNRTVQISSLDPTGYFPPSFRTFSMDLNKKARSVDNINHKKIDFKNTFNSIFWLTEHFNNSPKRLNELSVICLGLMLVGGSTTRLVSYCAIKTKPKM